MRELKFRAWDKVKEKWYKNVLPLSDGMFLIEDINGYKEVVSIPSFINDRAPNEFAIMQFTGLKDKNGNEIYEGDILDEKQLFVAWCDTLGGFTLKTTDKEFGECLSCNQAVYWAEIVGEPHLHEIIGNIYENPELLKQNT